MRTTIIIITLVGGSLLMRATSAQEQPNRNKHMMLMEVFRDSIMTDLMMDHIASDTQMHSMMMSRLIYYAVGDTPKMKDICRQILSQRAMHSVMIDMLDGRKNK